jgi:hypothetical protein
MLKRKYTKQQVPQISRRKLRTPKMKADSDIHDSRDEFVDLKDIGDAIGRKFPHELNGLLLGDESD